MLFDGFDPLDVIALEGRNAVTHVLGLDVLDATGVNVVRARVVDDGDRLTGHSKAGRLPRSAVKGVRRQGRIS